MTWLNFTAENNVLWTVSREWYSSLPVQAILLPLVLLSHLLLSHRCVSIHPVFVTLLIYFLLQMSVTLAASSLILSVQWVIKPAETINILNPLQQFAHNVCQNYLWNACLFYILTNSFTRSTGMCIECLLFAWHWTSLAAANGFGLPSAKLCALPLSRREIHNLKLWPNDNGALFLPSLEQFIPLSV